jgi:uncharacterized protein (DUF983 family)
MPESTIVTSTSQLTPDGVLGYAKGIAVTVGAILTAVVEVVGEDWEYARWLQLGIAICTIIATIAIPNPVKPVVVAAPPAPPPPAA